MDKETLNIQNCVKELHAQRKFLIPGIIGLCFSAILFAVTGVLCVSTFSSNETIRIIFASLFFALVTAAILGFVFYFLIRSLQMKTWIDQGQFYIVEDRLIDFGYSREVKPRKNVLNVSVKEIVEKSEAKPTSHLFVLFLL